MVTTPNYDLDVDTTLGGNNASDYIIPSQKAIKAYVDNSTGATVDQTYDGTSTNAQSGVAIEGELSTNYQSKLVSGTNIKTINNISLLGSGNIEALQNTANHDNSLCIYGTLVSGMASTEYGTAVGYLTQAGVYANAFGMNARATGSWAEAFGGNCDASGNWAIRIGHNGDASGQYSIAIGGSASASANYAIQLGKGTNSTASSLQIGFGGTSNNYTLLDGTTGLIPDARINSALIDGAFVSSVSNIIENGTINANTTTSAYSLSSYLPNDSHTYEIFGDITGQTSSTAGQYVTFFVEMSGESGVRVASALTRTSSTMVAAGYFSGFVNSTRTIKVTNSGTSKASGVTLRLLGYRRVGTNA